MSSPFYVNSSATSINGLKANICGYTGFDVPEEYIVTLISSYSNKVVRAILQDQVRINTSSKWETFIDILRQNDIANVAELAAQLSIKRSLQNAMTSRRIWRGTDPLSLTLTLKFQEEYNAIVEVMEACETLQSMVLPGEGSSSELGSLIPPGPSPFLLGTEENSQKESDLIAVYVGKFLGFTNVIMKSVEVIFDSRIGQDGLPKSAVVNVVFETYEIVTKNRLVGRSPTKPSQAIYRTDGISDEQRYTSTYQKMFENSGHQFFTEKQLLNSVGDFVKDGSNAITGMIGQAGSQIKKGVIDFMTGAEK